MRLNQHIKQSHQKTNMPLEIKPNKMTHFLDMTNDGQYRQDCLPQHPVIPLISFAQLQVGLIGVYQSDMYSLALK